MPYVIRPALPSDLRAIVRVFLGCWRDSYAAVLPRTLIEAMDESRATALWSRALAEAAPGEVLVAVDDGSRDDVLGVTRFASGGEVDGVRAGAVHSLYVSPRAQGRGLGARLLAAAATALTDSGCRAAALWVFRDNTPSIAFYARQGWLSDGGERVQAEFGEPEIRLRKELTVRNASQQRNADTTGTLLESTVARLVNDIPDDAPAGTTPPAGVALAYRSAESAGSAVPSGGAVFSGSAVTGNRVGHLPMTLETAHDLASVTKIVATTVCLMRLVSDGLVGLDDPVHRFIPAFTGGEKSDVTVRDLLLHRGGLWEWHPIYLANRDLANGDQGAALRFAAELPLRYAPKTARHYSDLGFMLLGEIVARVTGMPLDAAAHTLALDPLGMTSTAYSHPVDNDVAASAFGDLAEMAMVDTGIPYPVPYSSSAFRHWRRETIVGEVNDGNAFHALGAVFGHAGLFSTVPDLIAFSSAMADYAEHDALFSPAVAEQFFAPGPDDGQSLGFRRYPFMLHGEHVELVGHTGFVGCATGFVPGRGVAVAFASNRLLTPGIPVANDRLWQTALAAVSDELSGNR